MNRRNGRSLQLLVLMFTAVLGGCAEMKSTMEQMGVIEHRDSIPAPSGPKLDRENLVFYHQAFLATPFNVEELLKEGYSAGSKKDEFAKQAAIREDGPVVVRRTERAKQNPGVSVVLSISLGEYDFKAHVFATGFSKDFPMAFETNGYNAADLYAIAFVNGDRYQQVAVPESTAQTIVARFQAIGDRDRKVIAIVTGKVVGAILGSSPADPETKRCVEAMNERTRLATIQSSRLLNIGPGALLAGCDIQRRVVRLRVDKIDYYLANGKLIGSTGTPM